MTLVSVPKITEMYDTKVVLYFEPQLHFSQLVDDGFVGCGLKVLFHISAEDEDFYSSTDRVAMSSCLDQLSCTQASIQEHNFPILSIS